MTLKTGDFTVTDGELTEFQSSPGAYRGFCGTCGSMVPWLEFADNLPRLPGDHWKHGYPKRD
jgi:hypothetical protein